MEGIASFDADGRVRAHDPRGHDGEDWAGDRGEVVGSHRGEPPCTHPPDASISYPGGRGFEGDMERVDEGHLDFLPQTDAAGLQAGGKRDIDDNKNERMEVKEAPREMEVARTEGKAADDYGEYGIDSCYGGSP